MKNSVFTIMTFIATLCVPVIVAGLPLYQTEFVVDTTDSTTTSIIENAIAFINSFSQIVYSPDNITITSV